MKHLKRQKKLAASLYAIFRNKRFQDTLGDTLDLDHCVCICKTEIESRTEILKPEVDAAYRSECMYVDENTTKSLFIWMGKRESKTFYSIYMNFGLLPEFLPFLLKG